MIFTVTNAIYATAYVEAWKIQDFNGVWTRDLAIRCDALTEVTGSKPVEVLNFSGFYIRNCINCVHSCEDHSLLDFTSAVQYMKYNFTSTCNVHSPSYFGVAADCPEPSVPINGVVIGLQRKNGDTVRYECDVGFKLVGVSYATCQNNAWSAQVPSCDGRSFNADNEGKVHAVQRRGRDAKTLQ